MSLSTQIRRVAIKDYKSIASCDVNLGPLTFLVGPNGSGKSNFLDALGFVADALRYSLDYAVRERGGLNEIVRRSPDRAQRFSIRLDIDIKLATLNGSDLFGSFQYFIEIDATPLGGFSVLTEQCEWQCPELKQWSGHFNVRSGTVQSSSIESGPPAARDRLYLVTAAGIFPLDALYRALSSTTVYNLAPDKIRELQSPGIADLLARDGSNLTAIFSALLRSEPDRVERITEFLRLVVPAIQSVQAVTLGHRETLEFVEHIDGAGDGRRFYASSMSDGTLRTLGILVALFQRPPDTPIRPPVAIEEPEIALHPGAAEILLTCLQEASLTRQVLVTTHSPDLLDRKDILVESILAVSADDGNTRISPIDKAGREMLERRLWTAGELMRIDQLTPDPSSTPTAKGPQMRLFP